MKGVLKNPLLVLTALIITMALAGMSWAKGSYGSAVNDFCLNSDPYTGDCALCHSNSAAQEAYLTDNLCYFCPTDDACVTGPIDADHDGYDSSEDCNDNDPTINPGAIEDCADAKDNDCNGFIDAQDPECGVITCTDLDGDGFSVEGFECGTVDCNDDDSEIFPGADDICNDGIDQDCSGKDRTKGKGCGKPGKSDLCTTFTDQSTCVDNGCRWNKRKESCR